MAAIIWGRILKDAQECLAFILLEMPMRHTIIPNLYEWMNEEPVILLSLKSIQMEIKNFSKKKKNIRRELALLSAVACRCLNCDWMPALPTYLMPVFGYIVWRGLPAFRLLHFLAYSIALFMFFFPKLLLLFAA